MQKGLLLFRYTPTRYIFIISICFIVTITCIYLVKKKNERIVVHTNQRTQKVYTGFALKDITTEKIQSLDNTIQHSYSIIMTYKQWGNSNNAMITRDFLEIFDKAHKIPMITWEPWNPERGVNQPDFQLKQITNGTYDTYITTTAKNIRSYGKPVILRFAHEMNANWYPWSGSVNKNTPKDYIAAWRHVYTLFFSI